MNLEENQKLDVKRFDVPLKLKDLEIIGEALNYYYVKMVDKADRHEAKTDEPRKLKTTKRLAEIQEVLQYMLLMTNLVTGKLNEAFLASVKQPEETSDSIGEQELAGEEGTQSTST